MVFIVAACVTHKSEKHTAMLVQLYNSGYILKAVTCTVAASGYGFYRPQMTLFDPGWRGEQARGPEDWGVADLGNDPMGIIDR